ncbi:MAG: THUMP domain-containing protein [Thaumarchaeota archaeon]|nr:THUMP domain-containing protein [Nitrososphaerota archaeon]
MNLIVTSQKGSEAKASAEFKEIALQHGLRKVSIEKSAFDGILELELEEPRVFVAFLREYVRSEPFRIHFVQRIIPVDVVVDTVLEQIKEAAKVLGNQIGEGESFKIEIDERDSPYKRRELIDAIADVVDRKVNLESPDKILQVEVLGEYTAMCVARPDEIISIVKLKRTA